MAKWAAYGRVCGSKYLGQVEADSEDEAKEKAMRLDSCFVSLCHHCSGECEDPEVDNISVEKDEE